MAVDSWTLGPLDTWTLGNWTLGHLDTWTLGHLYSWTDGHLDTCTLELQEYKCPSVQVSIAQESKCPRVQVSKRPLPRWSKGPRVQCRAQVQASKGQCSKDPMAMAQLSNGSIVQWATEYVVTVVVVLFILFPSHSRRRAVTSKFHVVLTAQKNSRRLTIHVCCTSQSPTILSL